MLLIDCLDCKLLIDCFCCKFGISRTEDGEWIMNSDPNSDAEAVTAEVIE